MLDLHDQMPGDELLAQHFGSTTDPQTGKRNAVRIDVDPELALLLGSEPISILESVTYTYSPPHPNRVQLLTSKGKKLGQFGDLNKNTLATFTKVRAQNQAGAIETYWVLRIFVFAQKHYKLNSPRRPEWDFHLAILNAAGGFLYEWRLSHTVIDIRCGYKGKEFVIKRSFDPDLYNDIAAGMLHLKGGTLFRAC